MPQDGNRKKLQLIISTDCSEDYTISFEVQLYYKNNPLEGRLGGSAG